MEEQLRGAWLALHADLRPEQDEFDAVVQQRGRIESVTGTEAAIQLVRRGDYALVQRNDLDMLTNRGDTVAMQFGLGVRHEGKDVDVLVRIDLKAFPEFAAARLSARESERVRLDEAIRRFNSLGPDARRTALAEGRAAREAMRQPPVRLADETALEFSARLRARTAKLLPSGVVIDPTTLLMRRRE